MSDSTAAPLVFKVSEEHAGQRLDAFLVEHCPDFSRNRIQTEMTEGRILVQGKLRPKGFRLKAGWEVTFNPGPVRVLEAVAQDLPLDIVYQDEDILVVNKAVGMVVHPAVGHPKGTLVNALLYHFKDLNAGGDPLRPGIVHRLDRETSGLMVVALNDAAHTKLGKQLQDRVIGRTYETISWGQWHDDAGKLVGDIGRHPHQRVRMAVVEQQGRHAVTHYEVLEDFGFVQYCRVKLETGRTHQIRVHFHHNHHPVVGDRLYGDDRRVQGVHPLDRVKAQSMVKNAGRQLLHARKLELIHPRTEETMVFSSKLPGDMRLVLDGLREGI